MNKELLMFRGGIRTAVKPLATGKFDSDGKQITEEHTLHYKARTPNELAEYFGTLHALSEDGEGAVARQKYLAKFIAASMCDEAGEPLMTAAEAELIKVQLKFEIASMIVVGSNESGDAGKG